MVDICWIVLMSKVFYKENIESIQKSVLLPKIIPSVLAYFTLLLSMFFVCIPLSSYYSNRFHPSFVFGIVGFCIYGVYNFTNGAIFTDYNWTFMGLDTLWGTTCFALFGMLYTYLK
jgi:uncharacterized membrane protein